MLFLFIYLYALIVPATIHKSVELHCTHFRNNIGFVRIAVYNNAQNFCNESIKPFKEVSGIIKNNESDIIIYDLPDGDYAFTVLHDENEDAIMNYNFFGLPKEGYGFSNNTCPKLSKPSFKDCKVSIFSNTTFNQSIQVKYLF